MEHARHVFRVLLLFLVLVVAITVGRTFAVPDSYGMKGSYRYANVAEQRVVRPPLHGGVASCQACHAERVQEHQAGAHKPINCEVCHGPVGLHAADGKKIGAARVEKSYTLCVRCHAKITGRPATFPQVELPKHVAEKDQTLDGAVCMECHNPHAPTP